MKKKKTHGKLRHTARQNTVISPPPRKNKVWIWKWLGLTAALLLGGAIAWQFFGNSQPLSSLPPGQKWNVLLISIDTLRADYLKLYNSSTGTETPNLQALASEGILFKNAISQIPYTLPSHSTMFTGLYPISHGMKDNVEDILPNNIPTIAEIFKKNGYSTAGFIGSMALRRETGLDRGFEYYDDFLSRADVRGEDLGAIERRAQDVVFSFQNWFDKRDKQKPFFSFVHFYDPHDPYEPPTQFYPAIKTAQEFYKGEIRYVDSVIGNLFDTLRQRGVWDDTVVIVTSDHGEMLNEHGEYGHGFFLYNPVLHVPLIFHVPGNIQPRVISDQVQLVDLAPTVLSLTGLPMEKNFQGESLLPLIWQGAKKKNRLAFSESYFASIQMGVSPILSVQEGNYKYIESPRPELYNLEKDSAEMNNLFSGKRKMAESMKQKLAKYQQAYQTDQSKVEQRKITAEEAEQFAALGYLGGNVSEEQWDRKKDPKDYIDEWTRLLDTTLLVKQGRFADALTLIGQIIAEADRPSVSILILQTKCYTGLGDYKKAEQAAKLMGDSRMAATYLAGIYTATGRIEEADREYKRALQEHFSYFVLYNYAVFLKNAGRQEEAAQLVNKVLETRRDNQAKPMLAEIYFLLQDWKKAEQLLTDLIEERPWEAKWYVQLASVYQSQEKPQQALLLLRKHLARFPENPEFLLRLGILSRVNAERELEIGAFQRMIRVAPKDPRGYLYLAKALLDHTQNTGAAIQYCQKGFQLNPDLPMKIFGHYLLSDAYQAAGKLPESEKQLQMAKQLESRRSL
jgi:arylsulfatase A-like enzyme/lipopolysaccharide biosynthesis regulator YciM